MRRHQELPSHDATWTSFLLPHAPPIPSVPYIFQQEENSAPQQPFLFFTPPKVGLFLFLLSHTASSSPQAATPKHQPFLPHRIPWSLPAAQQPKGCLSFPVLGRLPPDQMVLSTPPIDKNDYSKDEGTKAKHSHAKSAYFKTSDDRLVKLPKVVNLKARVWAVKRQTTTSLRDPTGSE
ncbi:hypothetical protein BJ508DRAFT_323501 [Ascobolus immersus RN42]|uniref:Uncharacterized protein n=1 Tax=Ascobolus immersus RN42 TaxID=1160509 RepID=A0A3N4IEM9_ASCIM|nr:hypothetical protein BJ508DRAFT_323501 [Ascobolus immersus RN42]